MVLLGDCRGFFGNGNIAIGYGSYPSSGTAALQLVVFTPDGLTILSRTTPLTSTGSSNPLITCSPLANGNVQVSILSAASVTLAEIDFTGNVVGTSFAIPVPSSTGTRGTSFGQY